MTERCSKRITPDSLTGMIFALEGMKNIVVLLNGPMGCKFYHSTTSQFLALRPPLYLPAADNGEKVPVDYNFLNNWFFRQSRVPCTYLDGYDYVYGTGEKVEAGLRYLKEHIELDLLAVVNSPGASLIGDHLKDLAEEVFPELPIVILESPGYSLEFCDGYEAASMALLTQVGEKLWDSWRQEACGNSDISQLENERNTVRMKNGTQTTAQPDGVKSVNLLGLSIWQRNLEGDLRELRRLFGLCGIRVNTCLCAGSSLKDLKKLPEADLNVALYPELGARAANYLEQKTGTPAIICPGPPIGFAATEELFTEICRRLGTDVSPLLRESEQARARAWFRIDGVHQMCGLPDGARFALEGTCPEVYAYCRFFMEYLGMIPDSLSVSGGETTEARERLRRLLDEGHAGRPDEKDLMDTDAELVFGNANTIAALQTRRDAFCGIEIAQPGMGYIDVIPKTTLGIQGSLFLIEQVLNGLMSKI